MSVNRTWHPDTQYRILQALTLTRMSCPQGKSTLQCSSGDGEEEEPVVGVVG